MTTPPPVLSPHSVLPPLSSCCHFVSAKGKKFRVRFQFVTISAFANVLKFPATYFENETKSEI